MSPEINQQLEELIAENRLEEAVALMREGDKWLPESAVEDLLLLTGRLRHLQQQETRGIIATEDAALELNKIRAQLLELIQEYSKPPEELARQAVRKLLKWLVPLVVVILFMAGLGSWLSTPQPLYPVTADLLVDRLTFRFVHGSFRAAEGILSKVFIQNYQSAVIGGDRVLVDSPDPSGKMMEESLQQPLTLTASEVVSGLGLHFGNVRLEEMALAGGSLITLYRPLTEPGLLQMTIQHDQPLTSSWTFLDSLNLDVEMTTVGGISQPLELFGPTHLTILPPAGMAREIQVDHFPGTAHLDLHLQADQQPVAQALMISEPTFYRPVESVAVPTIIQGSIRIGQIDKPALQEIGLTEGTALDILSDQDFALQHISFTDNGINLKFSGNVTNLQTGQTRISRSPSRLAWWRYRLFN